MVEVYLSVLLLHLSVVPNFYLHEALYLSTADRALACLKAHYLGTLHTQTQVATRQYDCVLAVRVADDALPLVSKSCSCLASVTLYAIDVIHVQDGVVIDELLLDVLKLEGACSSELERPVSVLTGPLGSALVLGWVNGFHTNHDRKVIFLKNLQVILIVGVRIDDTYFGRELLVQPLGKLESHGLGVVGVRVKIEGVLLRVSYLLGANINCDFAFVVAVHLEGQEVLVWLVGHRLQFERVLL